MVRCVVLFVLPIFFENTNRIYLKLCQELGTVDLNQLMAVLCLGKFLFWVFWPNFDQKYIVCGNKRCFCRFFLFFAYSLILHGHVLFFVH